MKLKQLGEDLKNVVETGFVEGEWIEDKFEQAIKLQREIQEVLDYIADIEFRAKMGALRMDIKGTDLTLKASKTY